MKLLHIMTDKRQFNIDTLWILVTFVKVTKINITIKNKGY